MSIRELDLSFNYECPNCNGHGFIYVQGPIDEERIINLASNGFALNAGSPAREFRCVRCKGEGKKRLPDLELEKENLCQG